MTVQTAADEPAYATRSQIMAIIPGLMLVMLLAMLDNTIVGTAMPRIVGELGGLSHLSWVVTSYVLASTVAAPLYGKLGDQFGRARLFYVSIGVFLLGSILTGAAQTMGQLIAFRAVQGLGAGGLFVGVMAIIGDLVSPRQRGQYQGYFAGVMVVGMIGGPLLGGLLTDHLSWRWAFYVNLPLGAIALVVLALKLRLPLRRQQPQIDYLGIALLAAGTTALVLVATWGGTQYAWGSSQIVSLLVLGAASLALFVLVETRAAEPVLPLRLFRDRNFSLASGIGFLQGFALFGAVTFLPLYQQTVQGASATASGMLLLPLMFGALGASVVAGRIITKTGRYKVFPILGTGLMLVGTALLALLDVGTSRWTSGAYMLVLGTGMGLLMQLTVMIAQNSVGPRDMGVASSTAMFFRAIGGSFGVSIFGAIFTHRLTGELAGRVPPEYAGRISGTGGRLDPATLADLPPAIRDGFLNAFASATASVFAWAILFNVAGFLLAWFIKEVPLRTGPAEPAADRPVLANTATAQ